jgi:hypothetical protein
MNKKKMVSGRAQKNALNNVFVTRSLARLMNAIWPVFGRETNEINSNAKSKFTPSQPLTVGLPQS